MMMVEEMQTQVVASGDASLFTRTIGGYDGGPALIILHGGPGISHEYLLGLAALANKDLRIVFYDQRQVGRSTGTAATTAPMTEWAEDLEAVRRAIGVERVHLLGHSAGGFPAIAYGSLYPERTESIIFVDSVPPTAADLGKSWEHMLARLNQLQAAGALQRDLPQVSPEDGAAFIRSDLPSVTPEDGTAFITAVIPVVHVAKPVDPAVLNDAHYRPIVGERLMDALGDFDLRGHAAQLTMPTLTYVSPIPFGEAHMSGALYDALPKGKARRFTLPDCGHLPWIECPEPFFAEVRSFLQPLVDAAAF